MVPKMPGQERSWAKDTENRWPIRQPVRPRVSRQKPFLQCATTGVSTQRSAVRPRVENSAVTGTSRLLSTAPTSSLASVLPLAQATSIRNRGPTSVAWSFQRGVFSQL